MPSGNTATGSRPKIERSWMPWFAAQIQKPNSREQDRSTGQKDEPLGAGPAAPAGELLRYHIERWIPEECCRW